MSASGDGDRGSGGGVGERPASNQPKIAPPERPTILLVDDPRFDRHVPPGHHPERPERLHAARDSHIHADKPSDVLRQRIDGI